MALVKLNIEGEPKSFDIYDEDKKVGEMIFAIQGKDLTVYHTEVDQEEEGKGYAKLLFDEMIKFARENNLLVIPLCSYVHLQFKRQATIYNDIWNKAEDK
jgi:predicted GNAT family acetyltransferase